MRSHQKPNGYHVWVRLFLSVSLALGLLSSVLVIGPGNVALADPPTPPPEEFSEEITEDQTAPETQPPTPTPSEAQRVDRERKAELQAGLAALEAARQVGPEAVVALLDTLSGEALDLAMDEIVKAQIQLARMAPTRPPTPLVGLAEEEAMFQAQLAYEAANRARALTTRFDNPVEGQSPTPNFQASIASPTASRADLTVGNGCTYATIGAAIIAANPGDTLLIEGGVTFTENVVIPISLTLQGGYNGCASGSTARTTIDGGAADRVIVINPGLTVTLESLNITNGSTTDDGAGIWFAPLGGTGTLNLNHVDIYNNTARWGAGLWVGQNAKVVGTNVEIYNNTATETGGGVRLWGGRATFSDGSNIRDNSAPIGGGYAPALNLPASADVYDNQALTGDGLGGGVYMQEGTVTLADASDIRSNDASYGGGAYLLTSTLTISSAVSEIMFNTAITDGGGIYAQGSTINLNDDADLLANQAGAGGVGNGGGAYLDQSSLYSHKASIRFNTAAGYGGGVYAANASTVTMDLGGYPCAGPRCSQLSNNTATNGSGGGVYAYGSDVWLNNTFVENNTAILGGGVYAYGSAVYADNNLFAENDATSTGNGGGGDGIRLYIGGSLNGTGNTLAYNDAGGAATGNALGIHPGAGTLTMTCSIVWGHASSIGQTGGDVTYSDIEGGYGTGNLNVDPQFVSAASDDYHLQSASPVIDQCPYFAGLDTDFDNEIRPVVYISPATPYDMGADEARARVGINGAGCAYGSIQQAVNAASSGDTLQAVADVYTEMVDIASKDLTIESGYAVTDCLTYVGGQATVDGSGGSDSVFDITDSAVTLRNLDITGGNSFAGGGVSVAPGNSRVTLDNSNVFGNQASYGGGLYIDVGNVLTITNNSDVINNTATVAGGGAHVWGALIGDETLSDISANIAPDGGGVAVMSGTLILRGSDMSGNQATGANGRGGGIYVVGGVITMTSNAWIYNGHTAYDGAGIYADNAGVYIQGGNTIAGNIASNNGGGVYLSNNSHLDSSGGNIGYPSSGYSNEAVFGAGMYVLTSTVDFEGHIYNNIASDRGAGIYARVSTITLTSASVGGTGDYQANQLSAANGFGVGLYLTNDTHATLSNTVVASNTFPAAAIVSFGGGAYVTGGSVLTLTNSTIERHIAPSADQGRGAGVYVNYATLTLDNSQVLSNTTGTAGGGVRVWGGASTLNILNGSELRNNQVFNGAGGAIAVAGGAPDINISNSTLGYNDASADGGAIYMAAGTLDMTGWWDMRWNQASGNGGAIAVVGSGDVNLQVTDGAQWSYFFGNRAYGGNGGALYLNNGNTAELYANNGHTLFVNYNYANNDGGVIYAGSGAQLDVWGRVAMSTNSAGDNGGALYLDSGSGVWLHNSGDDVPGLYANEADNGGAIYAQGSPRVECDGAVLGSYLAGNQATAGDGGAVYLSGSTFDASNCAFGYNQATGNGGAVAAYTSTVAIEASYSTCDPLSGQCSSFYSNTADSDGINADYGGAIYVDDSTLSLNHTYLHRNSAWRGGAIYQLGTSASSQVNNSLFYSNTVDTDTGAAIRVAAGSFTVTHVTLADNPGIAPAYSAAGGTSNAAHNSIAWGNEFGGFQGTFVITSCNIDQSANVGIAVDPQFAAPGAGEDYHLLGGSPAIDACAAGLSPDLDNVARPFGSSYDMGAYEYAYSFEFAPDRSGNGEPSSVVAYTHTLTNTGSSNDTYTLAAQSSQNWGVTIVPSSSVMLDGGLSTPITVTINIPSGVLSGTVDSTVITATSNADPGLTAAVTDSTTVEYVYRVEFAPDRSGSGEPSSIVTYTHTLTNTGSGNDTYTLAAQSSQGWGVTIVPSPTVMLDVGLSTPVTVTINIPSGVPIGTVDSTVITAASNTDLGVTAIVSDLTTVTDHTLYLPIVMKDH